MRGVGEEKCELIRPLPVVLIVTAGVLATSACARPGPAGEEDIERNRAIVTAFVEAINARDFDALDSLVSPDIVRHSQATPDVNVTDLESFKAFLRSDFEVVPDALQQVRMMAAEDGLVAVWATYTGTQRGTLGPFPPLGNRAEADFAAFLRLEHGRIEEIWVIWDNLTILTQLGHWPPAPAPVMPRR